MAAELAKEKLDSNNSKSRQKLDPKSFLYSGIEKAAILIFSLPEDQALKILRELEPLEVRDLSETMIGLGMVRAEAVESICLEFVREISGSGSLVGSVETTKRLLSKVIDEELVDKILEDIRGPAGKNLWEKLASVDEEVLAGYLKNESPQTIAVIMSRVRHDTAAKVLSFLPESIADDVVTRLLRLDKVRKETLDQIEITLHNEFISTLGKSDKQDPYQIVAEVFNNLDRTNERRFLQNLEEKNPEAAERVRNLMFTFEDIGKLSNAIIGVILKGIDRSRLALALKGCQEQLKNKFTATMSERGLKLLNDEISVLGPVKLKDVELAQGEIVARAKDLSDQGVINIHDDADSKDQFIE